MKRFVLTAGLMLLWVAVACGQTRGGRLRGEWVGTGFQTDSGGTTWAMKLTVKGRSYAVDYPSLECGGTWRLLRRAGGRVVFRETITRGAERCAQRGTVVVEFLNSRQLGFWYSQNGSNEVVASAILNRAR